MANKRNLIALALLGVVGIAAYAAKASASVSDNPDGTAQDSVPSGIDLFSTLQSDLTEVVNMVSGNWKTGEYPKYAGAIADAETRNGIPTDLLARLLYQESHFRADIINGTNRSSVGAVGIAQFMPATGKQYGLYAADGTDLRTDPFASIAAAGKYLRALRNMFSDWNSAIMAYNWGPGNVAKYNRGEILPENVPIESSQYVAQITADVPVTA